MARVFVEMGDLESAIAVREAAEADGHDVEMVESPGEIESRLLPSGEDMALVLTGALDEALASSLSGAFAGAIPRPPLIAVVPESDPEELRRIARLFDLDAAIPAPPDPDELQVALQTQLDRYRLQVETGLAGRTDKMREVLERIRLIAPVNSTVLITGEMVQGMSPGSVIVDLAAERGGNCELTRANEVVVAHGVTILGPTNLVSRKPYHASQMFAKNVATFLLHLNQDGRLHIDTEDEITRETLVAHQGQVVNPRIRDLLATDNQADPAETTSEKPDASPAG